MIASERTMIVVGLFDNQAQAESAIRTLTDSGIDRNDISLVSRDRNVQTGTLLQTPTGAVERDTTATHVAEGAMMGGIGGLLVGLATLAIPGVGPIIAAGPIASVLATTGIGAGLGAAGGGMIGVIRNEGIPEEDAQVYAEGVRRGSILVIVKTTTETADRIESILNENGAVNIEERSRRFHEGGWTQFDEKAEPYAYDPDAGLRDPETGVNTGLSRGTRLYNRPGDTSGEFKS